MSQKLNIQYTVQYIKYKMWEVGIVLEELIFCTNNKSDV